MESLQVIRMIGSGATSHVLLAVEKDFVFRSTRRRARSIRDVGDERKMQEENFVDPYSEEWKQTVAVKVVDKCGANGKDRSAAIESELKVLRGSTSPFLVGMKFVEEQPDRYLFGMEYCPGGDLLNLMIAEDTMDVASVLFYGSEIAMGLQYLHDMQVIWGDLKPENVVIGTDGHIRLCDFGLSIHLTEEDNFDPQTGKLVCVSSSGTLQYTAPSVLMRQPNSYDADWWSFGVLLYELVFGHLPWDHPDQLTLCNMICFEPLQKPPLEALQTTYGYLMWDLIKSLLLKEPSSRLCYQDGLSELKQHPVFKSIDWSIVQEKGYSPPVIPGLKHVLDVSNFDTEFTSKPLHQFVSTAAAS